MKIAVIGASGKSGSVITKEALARGHKVTGIVRDASKDVPAQAQKMTKDILAPVSYTHLFPPLVLR